MPDSLVKRLVALELAFGVGACETCHGKPQLRIVTLNEDLRVTGETIPESCPGCGKPVESTLELVGLTLDELP